MYETTLMDDLKGSELERHSWCGENLAENLDKHCLSTVIDQDITVLIQYFKTILENCSKLLPTCYSLA